MFAISQKGYIQVAAACILYGLMGIFIKLITDMPLGSIIFYRMFFALVAITFYLACSGRLTEVKLKEKKRHLLLMGLLEAGAIFSYFVSVRYTTVSIAVLLLYTAPVYVTLLSPLILKENITRRGLFALGLSIAGVVMVVRPDKPEGMNIIGISLGLASGLLYALMILTSRYLKDYYSGTAQATWSIIINMAVFSPFLLATDTKAVMDNLFLLILFGLIPTAMGSLLFLNGLGLVKAQGASIISLLEPASAVVFAFLILSEPVSSTTLLGGALILLGALMVSREGIRQAPIR